MTTIHVGHTAMELDRQIADSQTAAMLARERARDEQRKAAREADRREAIAAGWPVPADPYPSKGLDRSRSVGSVKPLTGATGSNRRVPGRPAESVPAAQPNRRPASTTTPSGLPVGSLVLSPREVTALNNLLDTPQVKAILGQARF